MTIMFQSYIICLNHTSHDNHASCQLTQWRWSQWWWNSFSPQSRQGHGVGSRLASAKLTSGNSRTWRNKRPEQQYWIRTACRKVTKNNQNNATQGVIREVGWGLAPLGIVGGAWKFIQITSVHNIIQLTSVKHVSLLITPSGVIIRDTMKTEQILHSMYITCYKFISLQRCTLQVLKRLTCHSQT